MRTLLLAVLGLCAITGCDKAREEPSKYCGKICETLPYTPVFENYAVDELNSVTVRHYRPDGSFSTNSLISESVYSLSDTVAAMGDNGQTIGLAFKDLFLVREQEHEIKVEATGRKYKIWNIEESEERETYLCSEEEFTCASKPKSYSFAGGQHRVEQSGNKPAYLILTR